MRRAPALATLSVAVVTFGFAFLGTAQPAHAAFRLGVDGIWVPVSGDRVESGNTRLDSNHKLASFGGSAHAGIGFNILSVGLKLNYFNEGLELEQESGSATTVRRDQLDVNAMGRVGVPGTKLGIVGEAGASMSTSFDGVGYNIGLGAEYGLFKIPLLMFNLGLEGQYVNLPADLNGQSTDNKTVRLLVYMGIDFGP